jgi:hypothetical protein
MKALRRLFVAVIALSLPLATLAQEAAKPAEPPKPAITPYGFVLLNAFWDGGTFAAKDYPGQAGLPYAAGGNYYFANQGGAFLMSARQSRVGFKLAMNDDNWTGAALTGVIEFDFKGGHFSCSATSGACATPASSGWNAGIMRLRLASATAAWKTSYGTWSVLAGQDYGLVNPLFATSVAWVADPIFWQAGNYWRRSPQIRAQYAGQMGAVGLTVQAAMLSPADGDAYVDYGAGNRSRTPDIEARLALKGKFAEGVDAQLGVGYHTNKRRYDNANNAAQNLNVTTDVTATLVGIDLDANLTQYLGLRGEWFDGKGVDDTYNGIRTTAVRDADATAAYDWQPVKSSGYWAQAVIKPDPKLSVTFGMGHTELKDFGPLVGATTAPTRQKNEQIEGGVILNAGKYWKVGLEYCQTTTTFNDLAETEKTASQIALSSMLSF